MAVLTPNKPLLNQNILLAITGSVAACKADRVLRQIQEAGGEVRVLLTDAGRHFFTEELAGALTESTVYSNQFDPDEPGRMPHIELKRWADAVLVAPATANRLLNIETPEADDLLSTVIHAFDGPVMYAPAMNPSMWNEDRIQSIIDDHREIVVLPDEGEMACGDVGPGRFAEPVRVVERLIERLWPSPMAGQEWVVSAGPTREPWDEIRFLSNRSSGRMGHALARVASWMGADVELISGTKQQFYPGTVFERERVGTTREMLEGVLDRMTDDKGYIGASAVSDYRPKTVEGKVESDRDELSIPLENNPDIIRELRETYAEATIVGFSADDSDDPGRAVEKANDKGMDAVVFNSINQPEGGMESEDNHVYFCRPEGDIHDLGHRSKLDCAGQVWLCVNQFL